MKRAIICLMWVWVMGLGGNANAAFFGLFGGDEVVPVEPGAIYERCDPKLGFMISVDTKGNTLKALNEKCECQGGHFVRLGERGDVIAVFDQACGDYQIPPANKSLCKKFDKGSFWVKFEGGNRVVTDSPCSLDSNSKQELYTVNSAEGTVSPIEPTPESCVTGATYCDLDDCGTCTNVTYCSAGSCGRFKNGCFIPRTREVECEF